MEEKEVINNAHWIWYKPVPYALHATESFPSLPRLKLVYKEVEEEIEPFYLLNQHRQWQAQKTGTPTDPSSFFQLS